MQVRVSWLGDREWGQERQNGSGQNLTAGFSLLLLPSASLLECQVDDGTIGHVVVSQRVGILDENALENRRSASAQCLRQCGCFTAPNTLSKHQGLKGAGTGVAQGGSETLPRIWP